MDPRGDALRWVPGPGRFFRTFFHAVCVDVHRRAEQRMGRELRAERIAALAGVSANSIVRFESTETFPTENLERYAAAYADIDQLADARLLFQRAMDWWLICGLRPLTAPQEEEGPPERDEPLTHERIILAIRRAEASEEERRGVELPPSATRKRRANEG